ncbi:hypothetical protein GOAMI_50_00350 [Gordonia amicalis NBRC 100051 = JCM 11271]|nr:hypothetical protein GOAMI_50_00350 [Gordonia amicalis NBRC 100051 = JCM 11271]
MLTAIPDLTVSTAASATAAGAATSAVDAPNANNARNRIPMFPSPRQREQPNRAGDGRRDPVATAAAACRGRRNPHRPM